MRYSAEPLRTPAVHRFSRAKQRARQCFLASASRGVSRAVLFGLAASAAAGCAHLNTPLLYAEPKLDADPSDPVARYPRTRAEVDAYPFAQLGLRNADGSSSILVLTELTAAREVWTAGPDLRVVTQNGRLRGVDGSGSLMEIRYPGGSPLDALQRGALPASGTTYEKQIVVEGEVGARVVLRCTLAAMPAEAPQTVADAEALREYEEQCADTASGASTVSHYWIATDAPYVWRSVEQVLPDTSAIELDVLKRPASPAS